MRDRGRSQNSLIISVITVILVVCLDRILKSFFYNHLLVGESIPIIRNIFHITLVHNTGIAFGLFKNHGVIFIIIPIVTIIVIGYCLYRYHNHPEVSRFYVIAFSLILAGAMGNLIDRLIFGYVIDFIDFRIWPVFNLADSAITTGVFLILIKYIPSCIKITK